MLPSLAPHILDDLGDDLGDVDLLLDILAGYLVELPERQRTMRLALDSDDRSQLRSLAHSLGSASQMLGALELAAACATLERSALSSHQPYLAKLCAHWNQSCDRTALAMSDWLTTQGSKR